MAVFYEGGKKYNCRVRGTPYYRTSITINGKVKQVYGNGEKDAKRRIAELKKAADAGFDVSRESDKVGRTFEHWLYNVKRVGSKLKASSFARYDSTFRTHIAPYDIANRVLSKLNGSTMQEYINYMYESNGVSTSTIESTLKLWRMFLDWAIDEGYLVKNPAKKLTVPGRYEMKKKEVETFSEEERIKLADYMSATDYQYTTLIRLAFATGMRLGEIMGLMWSDIHEDYIEVNRSTSIVDHVDKNGHHDRHREVWETKTRNSIRQIPILGSTKEMMEAHRKEQIVYFNKRRMPVPAYVFTTSQGELIDPSSFAKSYRRLLKRAGIPYKKFHAIRHTFGTTAIRRGVNVKELQMLMGHADVETTYIYVHADEDTKRSAIERMGAVI